MNGPMFLANCSTPSGARFNLRVAEGRIAGSTALPGDPTIDLQGRVLRPGLINAHDHLQLNSLPRLKYRPSHTNVAEWIADIAARLAHDPQLLANSKTPRSARLLAGGLKNLLAGTTTVAHHDEGHPCFEDESFPVGVLRSGWSHSLGLHGHESVRAAYQATPPDQPWIVHAAEGIDTAAGLEFARLEELGCIGPNTVLVHGLALDASQSVRLVLAGAGLVWCPASNLHLFGRTIDPHRLAALGQLALGSDSRISGSRDLLDELSIARLASRLDEAALEALVTTQSAALLRLQDRGRIAPGLRADLMVLPAGLPLSHARRSDVELVLIGGHIRLADTQLVSGEDFDLLPVNIDQRPKLLSSALVAALRAADIQEAGLDLAPALETMP